MARLRLTQPLRSQTAGGTPSQRCWRFQRSAALRAGSHRSTAGAYGGLLLPALLSRGTCRLESGGRQERAARGAFDPRTSTDSVLRKHEECDKESARRRVQGALDQAGRRRAAASGCAMQGGLAGRTCGRKAFGRPVDVLLAAEKEVDLTAVPAFVSDEGPSFRTRTAPQQRSPPLHI